MIRPVLSLFLALLLVLPQGVFASSGREADGDGDSSWKGGALFWGAISLVNGALLASSISDLRFYESRAEDTAAGGGNADPYWDATAREKVLIGLSTISLLFSLAALRGSLSDDPAEEPLRYERAARAGIEDPPPSSAVKVLSLEGRVRYDTLFARASSVDTARATEVLRLSGGERESEEVAGETSAFPSGPAAAGPTEDSPAILAARPARSSVRALPAEKAPDPSPTGTDDPSLEWSQSLSGVTQEKEEDGPVQLTEPAPAAPGASLASNPEETEPALEGGAPTFALLPYAVHVSSFRTLPLAEEEEAEWVARGETIVIEETVVPGKGTWFRLYVGNFETMRGARAYAAVLESRYGIGYAQAQKRRGF